MMNNNILLVLSTAAQSPQAIEAALAKAKEQQGELVILFIADTEMATSIFQRLEGTMSMGERPGQDVQEALVREYQRQGEQQLEHIKQRAEEQGIEVKTLFKTGDFADECIAAIREHKIRVAVITRTRRSQLSRFIFGSPIKKIQDNTECEFEIVNLD